MEFILRNYRMQHSRPFTINFIIPMETKSRHVGCPFCNYGGCEYKERGYWGHFKWTVSLVYGCLSSKFSYKRLVRWVKSLDYSKIDDIEVAGINHNDSPDYVDAFIESASYKGRDMTEAELDRLNEDSDFVYQCIMNHIY